MNNDKYEEYKKHCAEWKKNPLKNPISNRTIQENGSVYKTFQKICSSPAAEKEKELNCLFTSTKPFLEKEIKHFNDKNPFISKHLESCLHSYKKPKSIKRRLKELDYLSEPEVTYTDISKLQETRKLSLSNCHDGQRKLTMSVLEFVANSLNKLNCNEEDVMVVYIGASGLASGICSLVFPKMFFLLYDPDPNILDYLPEEVKHKTSIYKQTNKMKTLNKDKPLTIFTERAGFFDDLSAKYCYDVYFKQLVNKKYLLFISDIRLGSDLKETDIVNDMKNQMHWTTEIHADRYMHKFRIPYIDEIKKKEEANTILLSYNDAIHNPNFSLSSHIDEQSNNNFLYLKGDLYIQLYGPQRSVELRLHGSKNKKTNKYDLSRYNFKEIENKLALFNTIYRSHCAYKYNDLVSSYEIVAEQSIMDLCKVSEKQYDELNTIMIRKFPYKIDHMTCILHSASQDLKEKNIKEPRKYVPHIFESAERVLSQYPDRKQYFSYLLQ